MHQLMADALEKALAEIQQIQKNARAHGFSGRPQWPMIILRTPKGWTGPKSVDGVPVEGTFRSHQVPVTDLEKPEHLKILEQWMKSYKPEELFDKNGKFLAELAELFFRRANRDDALRARPDRRPAAFSNGPSARGTSTRRDRPEFGGIRMPGQPR